MVQGSGSNKISIDKSWTGNTSNEGIVVWIDFDRNETFDIDEKILASGHFLNKHLRKEGNAFAIILMLVLVMGFTSHGHIKADMIIGKWTSEKEDVKFEVLKGNQYYDKITWGTK